MSITDQIHKIPIGTWNVMSPTNARNPFEFESIYKKGIDKQLDNFFDIAYCLLNKNMKSGLKLINFFTEEIRPILDNIIEKYHLPDIEYLLDMDLCLLCSHMDKKSINCWDREILVSSLNLKDIDFIDFFEPRSDKDIEHNLEVIKVHNHLVFYFI